VAEGPVVVQGVVIDIDEVTGHAREIKRFQQVIDL